MGIPNENSTNNDFEYIIRWFENTILPTPFMLY